MTTDLRYLALTAILTAALWIPALSLRCLRTDRWPQRITSTRRRVRFRFWGRRADRTYLNAVECFAPFAALVIVAHISGKADAMTAFWSACFFWLRLAHALVYLLGIPYVRTIIFTLSFVAVVGLFWEVIS